MVHLQSVGWYVREAEPWGLRGLLNSVAFVRGEIADLLADQLLPRLPVPRGVGEAQALGLQPGEDRLAHGVREVALPTPALVFDVRLPPVLERMAAVKCPPLADRKEQREQRQGQKRDDGHQPPQSARFHFDTHHEQTSTFIFDQIESSLLSDSASIPLGRLQDRTTPPARTAIPGTSST